VTCPLCLNLHTKSLYSKNDPGLGYREYWQCTCCQLVYILPQYRLGKLQERQRYDLHENSPEDQDYVQFLNQLCQPISSQLSRGARGLDYGCGPGPTVSVVMERQGFVMENYDPYYFPDSLLLEGRYDFVTCTEVVEHFYQPRREFLLLNRLLHEKNSTLGIMTKMYDTVPSFSKWWYHREPTHVCFYSRDTFAWIARWLKWSVTHPPNNVVIFNK